MLNHQAEVALQFLRWLYPQGPWCLTVINPDKREERTPTFTFYPEDEARFRGWLGDWPRHNVYYHVNKPTRDLTKKAERTDIGLMPFLHVDVDPRAMEDLGREQTRIVDLFGDKLPIGVPRPSGAVWSGGGLNALWRLEESIVIAGDLAKAEDAKRYNLQLEILFGGDNCHNVDRILRLPGTVNWPNELKKKKGRVATQSRVLWLEDSRYPISAFVAARPVQTADLGGLMADGGGVQVHVSGNVARLNHVSELGERVSLKTQALIVCGKDEDDPNKWGSRSELLFHVCCELVRADKSDDVIYAVITDPDFLISESVLDKGSGSERYALRQIKRAREEVIDPQLRALNEKHAIIANLGGKCRVIEEVHDYSLDRPRLTYQSFEDFRNRYMHLRVAVGKEKEEVKYQPLGQWWLQHSNRRQYESIVFTPGRESPNSYNLWRGFSCEAKPGDKHHSLLKHLLDNICDGREDYYEYLVKWMARGVQQPDCAGEVAVVFRGGQGTGKGTVATFYGQLWGRHFIQISNPNHLVGNFNSHLRDAVVVFADEAFYAGDKKHESILKTLITEQLLVIEGKGRDAESSRNFVHLMMASNGDWVVPAGPNERRYFVLDVRPYQVGNRPYWNKIREDMANGGRENLLHHLLTMSLDGYEVRDVPKTEALRKQKMMSMSAEQEWLYQKLQDGQWGMSCPWEGPVFTDTLLEDWLRHAQKINVVGRRSNGTVLGQFLNSHMPDGWPTKKQYPRQYRDKDSGEVISERPYAYSFPALGKCRAHWDQVMGGLHDWPDPIVTTREETF